MDDIEKLENQLKKMGKIPVSSEVSEDIKKKLFLSIQESAVSHSLRPSCISSLVARAKKVFAGVEIDAASRAGIKERVIMFVSSYSRPRFLFSRFFVAQKKAWASALIFLIIFNVFVFVDEGVNVAEAKYTVLKEVSGDVYVYRDNETLPGKENFVLQEGDVVGTGDNSKAVIRFLDDSISRLSQNTKVLLSRLFLDAALEVSDVVVDVKGGKIWSKVCKFVPGKSEFTVVAKDILTQASNVAAFNVSSDNETGEFKVDVFENTVDLHVVSDNEVISESVSEGSSAKVDAESSVIQLGEVSDTDEWIAENLGEDKKHIVEIAEETREEIKGEAGVLPESILHPIKRIKEDTHLLLAFDRVERAKIKLEIFEKRLLEAEALAASGETNELPGLMDDFQAASDEFLQSILYLKDTDLVAYVDLTTYLKGKLNKHKRNLLFIRSDDAAADDDSLDISVEPKMEEPGSIKPLSADFESDSDKIGDEEEVDEPLTLEERPAAPILDLYTEKEEAENESEEVLSEPEETQDNS